MVLMMFFLELSCKGFGVVLVVQNMSIFARGDDDAAVRTTMNCATLRLLCLLHTECFGGLGKYLFQIAFDHFLPFFCG